MNAIRIRLDTTDTQFPIFVEIEDLHGNSIDCGKWIKQDKDGLATIVITEADVIGAGRLNP